MPFIYGRYFGVELIKERVQRGVDAEVPVGLIQSAIGGSQIEAWMSNDTLTTCTEESLAGGAVPGNSGRLFYGMVAPFANYSVRGHLWYQGMFYGRPLCSTVSRYMSVCPCVRFPRTHPYAPSPALSHSHSHALTHTPHARTPMHTHPRGE